jgi:hypothetical protein
MTAARKTTRAALILDWPARLRHVVGSGQAIRQTAEELESATDTVDIPADDIQAMTDLLQEQIRDRQHLVYVLALRLP